MIKVKYVKFIFQCSGLKVTVSLNEIEKTPMIEVKYVGGGAWVWAFMMLHVTTLHFLLTFKY